MYKIGKPRGPWQTESEIRSGSKLRPVVIEMEARCLVMRLKGTRKRMRMTYSRIYDQMAMAEALAAEQARPNRRRRTVVRGRV